jgi:hypothetical protein
MFYIRGASFWQQDQVWQNRLAASQQDQDIVTAVTAKMNAALTNLSSGEASIANQRALARVQAQIKAAIAAAAKSHAITFSSKGSTSKAPASGTAGKVVNKTA